MKSAFVVVQVRVVFPIWVVAVQIRAVAVQICLLGGCPKLRGLT